ncbi:hypothetical protein B0H11DRAFT_1231407 [Mycena galericulata]|nr:hypothetical protein B0H11DRAFT_1231407 [Mycena galericulata]
MSAGFAFLPRKVAKAAKIPNISESGSEARINSVDSKGKGRALASEPLEPETPPKPQYSDEDYTILLCLSLSKYRLWSDPDLRRDIEWSSRASPNDGFFPLSYILEAPFPLSAAHTSETVIVKALRAHATDVVDVRMAIPSSDRSGRSRGNFEIRPKFWDDAVYPVSREGWDNRTVYVENIPIKHKTLPSVSRFVLGLLPASTTMASHNRIQAITPPAHHADDEGAEAKLKSFALITFADAADVESLLTAWPWIRRQHSGEDAPDASEAVKFGFRTLSKARWDNLNAQYLSYRAKLLADIKEVEAPTSAAPPRPPSPARFEPERQTSPVSAPATLASTMSYPLNCLVFVRNIHPETNKTTLRNFFAKAVDVKEAIDYVDFNKGMDSCYIRLTTPSHSKGFVDHFTQNHIVHANGLDDFGCPSVGQNAKPVEAELVLGKREEVYWEKVPEKVCLQAVQKALGLSDVQEENMVEGRRRQRKKQKR